MSKQWSDTTKRLVFVSLTLAALLVIYRFRAIIPPLLVALIIAYVLTPIVDYLDRVTPIPRSICVLVTVILFLALVATIPALAAPALLDEFGKVDIEVQDLLKSVEKLAGNLIVGLGINLELDEIYAQLSSTVRSLLSPALSQSVFLLMDVAAAVVTALFVFVVTFYLMRDYHRLKVYIYNTIPLDYRHDFQRLIGEIGTVWNSFFRGQIVLCLVIGIVVWLAMEILGMPNALALGLLAGVLEIIPNIGPVLSAVPAVIIALLQGSSWLPLGHFGTALVVTGSYIAIQQVENYFLVPRIIGGSVNLHPMVVIIGALAGARLAGVLGIFLAAPTLATLRVLLGYIYRKLLDMQPFLTDEVVIPVAKPGFKERVQTLRDLIGSWLVSLKRVFFHKSR